MLFNNLNNMAPQAFNNATEVDATQLAIGNPRDFCSLFRPQQAQSSWFFESMSSSYGVTGTNTPNVIHRPFGAFIASKAGRSSNYNYVIYCVIKAENRDYIPPDVTSSNQ